MPRSRKQSKDSHSQAQRRRLLFLEALEDRRLLAVVASDGFESGSFSGGSGDWIGGWVQANGSSSVTTSGSPQSGSRHALVQGGRDISRLVDISGLTDLQIGFDAKISSFESNDRAFVQARVDGGSWTTLKEFRESEGEDTYRAYTFDIAGEGDTLELRFDGRMNNTRWDRWYIDNVEVNGEFAPPAFPPTIDYPDFSNTSGLTLVGDAATTDTNKLRLTPAEGGQVGGAWFQEKQLVSVGFETSFQFQLTEGSNGADGSDGFAFVIQNTSSSILGNSGGKIGYHKIRNSVAIEFDTVKAASEPSDSHVSVQTRGVEQNSTFHEASIGSFTTSGFKLDDGNVHEAKIRYVPGTLSIFLDDFSSPSLSVPIDLGSSLDLDVGRAFVGFTAATGGGWENHDVLDWQFANTVDTSTTIGITGTQHIEGDSGPSTAEFEVLRMGDLSQPVTLDWSTQSASATPGEDYLDASGQITFAPGESTKTIDVMILGDFAEEDTEAFTVSLSVVSGEATLVASTGLGSILNDETSLSVSDALVTEGSETYRFIDTFVQPQSGGLKAASGIAIGPDGNLWLASNLPAEVLRYDSETGDFIDRFDSKPDSEFKWYRGLRFGPEGDGDWYVTSTKTHEVLRVDGSTGEVSVFVTEKSGGLDTPQDLVFGPDDNLYVASRTNEILRYQGPFGDSPGAFMGAFIGAGQGGLSVPGGMTFDPQGDFFYVSSNASSEVLKYDADGQFVTQFVESGAGGLDFTQAGGLLFGPDRNGDGVEDLYVSSRNSFESVLSFDGTDGSLIDELTPDGSGGLIKPGGMVFDADGNLLVVALDQERVLRYGVDSQAIFTLSLSKPSALPVTVDFASLGITASAGDDFEAVSGTITFAPGVTSRTIIVPTLNDELAEGNEAFELKLINATNATIVDDSGIGTIQDDGDLGNQPPVADAGDDVSVADDDGANEEAVTLNGSGTDLDGTVVGYEWSEGDVVLGTEAILTNFFDVGVHALSLTVTDNEGAIARDTVVVTVNANTAPTANGGADQSADDDDGSDSEVVTLTGSGSDSDGTVVAYEWKNGATILGTTASISPTLAVGAHTLTFTVTDNGGATVSDTVVVTVNANVAPEANAGEDKTVSDIDGNGSETVTLVGSGIDSDGGIASYQWKIGPTVLGTEATLTSSFDVGVHNLTFVVVDNGGLKSTGAVTVTVTEPPSGPKLAHDVAIEVGSAWKTITLPYTYDSMVVIATPNYDVSSAPAVVRIQNATSGNSFQMRVDPAGPTAVGAMDVHYVVLEEGVYNTADYKIEAVKFNSTVTDENNSWSGESRTYQQSYSAPVVVGQVMTYNDADWSVFWAAGASRTSAPTSTALTVGKHVGEDSDTTRVNETLGYLVIETSTSGTAEIEGLPYVAAVGGDSIRGVDNSPSYHYSYNAMPNSKAAVASNAGMDGGDGGWAILYGNNPITPTGSTIKLAIDEDQWANSERKHTTEQVAYFIIDPPLPEGSDVDAGAELWSLVAPVSRLTAWQEPRLPVVERRLVHWENAAERRVLLDASMCERDRAVRPQVAIDRFMSNFAVDEEDLIDDDLLRAILQGVDQLDSSGDSATS